MKKKTRDIVVGKNVYVYVISKGHLKIFLNKQEVHRVATDKLTGIGHPHITPSMVRNVIKKIKL